MLCCAECRMMRRQRYPEGLSKGGVLQNRNVLWKCKPVVGKDCPTYLPVVDNHSTSQDGKWVNVYMHWRIYVLIADITTHCCSVMRDVCAEYFQQHPMTNGGPGIEVEVTSEYCIPTPTPNTRQRSRARTHNNAGCVIVKTSGRANIARSVIIWVKLWYGSG